MNQIFVLAHLRPRMGCHASSPIPRSPDWQKFRKISENFNKLATASMSSPPSKLIHPLWLIENRGGKIRISRPFCAHPIVVGIGRVELVFFERLRLIGQSALRRQLATERPLAFLPRTLAQETDRCPKLQTPFDR